MYAKLRYSVLLANERAETSQHSVECFGSSVQTFVPIGRPERRHRAGRKLTRGFLDQEIGHLGKIGDGRVPGSPVVAATPKWR